MSPKLNGELHSSDSPINQKYSALSKVTQFLPVYKSLMATDTAQMQIDKLSIVDMIMGG
jgi:hypothetical protein